MANPGPKDELFSSLMAIAIFAERRINGYNKLFLEENEEVAKRRSSGK
jgi:hypothetical protein